MNSIFTINNPMPPIWMMYPHISQFSIGWRMGYGEGYKWDLADWLKTLTKEERKLYDEMFPEPSFWHKNMKDNYYESIPFWQKKGKMKYSIEELTNSSEQEYCFFWKPKPDTIDQSCLGQWQPSNFKVDTNNYTCTEQYMMAEKAAIFGDKEIEEQIFKTTDPKEMKALGRKVKNFDPTIWDKVKYSVVLNGNYYKFSQNKEMREFLLSTGNKILVEASPFDTIWGIGMKENNPNASNPSLWRGKNLLGFALMELRDELRKLYKNYDKINWEQLKDYLLE